MPSNQPITDGPSSRDRGRERLLQGGIVFMLGFVGTLALYFGIGMVSMWTLIPMLLGLFWMLTGLVTLLTGHE